MKKHGILSRVRPFFALLVSLIFCAVVAVAVYAKDLDNFEWKQGINPSLTREIGNMSPGNNINTSGVKFYCVATSSEDGTFKIKLQRQGFLWIWQDVGATYTCSQTSAVKYDTRNNTYVEGQPNLLTWSTTEPGLYRIVLSDASMPQFTMFTAVEAWSF